jgi:hypothetical protein
MRRSGVVMANISGLSLAARSRAAVAVAAVLTLASGVFTANTPKFYPDDPLWADDDASLDASRVVPVEDANSYDFVVNTFGNPGERRNVRALNINTLDEVPDSSWFTNRIGRMRLPTADLVRGPDRVASVSLDGWVVSSGKSTGVQPGFRMTDPQGHLHQIEFDPPSNPELATGAEIIGTAFYHAFGYNTVDVYLAELDADRLVISPSATQFDPLLGERRKLTRRDVDNVLRRAARKPNGKYRVLVSRFADGKPLGNFRYYGTRPDDPNDIVAHEHRRELRGARVFGAWLNHDDSRGVNSLDMLVTEPNRHYIKHYMFDFGSIMGSGTVYAQRHRPGNEYILEWKPGWLTLATLGLYARPWTRISYPEAPPSAGRFEADFFTPELWKPEYPNAAFDNMRSDDAFWAARIVAQFDAEIVRALVEKAQYTDPRATEYLTHTLMQRREKVLAVWLSQVNPLIDFQINAGGELTFDNVAEREGLTTPADRYRVEWGRFDNTTGVVTDTLAAVVSERRLPLPAAYVSTPPEYLQVRVSGMHPRFPAWSTPVTLHFRRTPGGWALVGLNRIPEA